ncbi:MAG: hypothetical protein JSR77_16920 [Planctomycetes bacterium]|nr:hypothetical protein [Planctomycetota bacterium]
MNRAMMRSLLGGMLLCGGASATEPGFYAIDLIPGATQSYALALSQTGDTAVGYWYGYTARLNDSYIWTQGTGPVRYAAAGVLAYPVLVGVSSDGQTVIGSHTSTFFATGSMSFVQHGADAAVQLPVLSGYLYSSPHAVSGSGLIVVGDCFHPPVPYSYQAFRWSAATGVQGLGFARSGDNYSSASAISRDGTTIVGNSSNTGSGSGVGFIWRQGTGMRVLSVPGFVSHTIRAVNANGTITVGFYAGAHGNRAVMWNAQRVATELGTVGGFLNNYAYGISDDGRVIAGAVGNYDEPEAQAFVWTPEAGMEYAKDYLFARGVEVPIGWRMYQINAVSGDGKTFCGVGLGLNGQTQGFVAKVGAPCPADFDHNGGVDGQDVQAFFAAWATGAASGDVNDDGGVDGADVSYFFQAWESGGCS